MSFNSLDKILNAIEQQPDWEAYRQFCRLLHCWRQVVAPQIAENARPLSISRNILWVATSSSVWAQTLSLQRYQLLKKLNAELPEPLKDIRFAPAQWYDNRVNPASEAEPPSHSEISPEVLAVSESPPGNTPESAFQRWAEVMQVRAQSWTLCPQCQCPTPPGELKRWDVCSFCAAKQWQSPAR
jgi:predicted nucleic acid-binding Zn ribbon protein